jgi:hypothetical protein
VFESELAPSTELERIPTPPTNVDTSAQDNIGDEHLPSTEGAVQRTNRDAEAGENSDQENEWEDVDPYPECAGDSEGETDFNDNALPDEDSVVRFSTLPAAGNESLSSNSNLAEETHDALLEQLRSATEQGNSAIEEPENTTTVVLGGHLCKIARLYLRGLRKPSSPPPSI